MQLSKELLKWANKNTLPDLKPSGDQYSLYSNLANQIPPDFEVFGVSSKKRLNLHLKSKLLRL